MVRSTDKLPEDGAAAPAARPFSFVERLREISMFFDGTDRVHQAMRTVAAAFEKNQIVYAILAEWR